MILTIKDRILITSVLPDTGSYIEMTVCQTIIDLVRFSANEIEEYELVDVPTGGVKYNQNKAKDSNIEFNNTQLGVLKKSISQLDKEEKITLDLLPLCEKINQL